jgi:hypothetical protein
VKLPKKEKQCYELRQTGNQASAATAAPCVSLQSRDDTYTGPNLAISGRTECDRSCSVEVVAWSVDLEGL